MTLKSLDVSKLNSHPHLIRIIRIDCTKDSALSTNNVINASFRMIEPCIQQTSRGKFASGTLSPGPSSQPTNQPTTTVCLTLASFVCLLSMTNNPDRMIIYRQQLIYCLFFIYRTSFRTDSSFSSPSSPFSVTWRAAPQLRTSLSVEPVFFLLSACF